MSWDSPADPAELCVGIASMDELWLAADDALTSALIFADCLVYYALAATR